MAGGRLPDLKGASEMSAVSFRILKPPSFSGFAMKTPLFRRIQEPEGKAVLNSEFWLLIPDACS